MEQPIFPAWVIRTLSFLVMILILLLILNQWKTYKGTPQVMSVSATGHITAIPDVATVNIGVVSRGAQPTDVKNDNNKKMNQVIDFVKAQGIESKNISTTTLNVSPSYTYTNGQNNITGYQAEQTITVKLEGTDTSVLQKIVNGVVDHGANQIQGVDFSFSDLDKWKSLAQKDAIKKAQTKATQLASDAHLHLDRVINVIESKNEAPMPIMYGASANFKAKSVAPTIEPGNQTIDEIVTLLYEVH